MLWHLDWGEAANKITEAARASGGVVPPLPFLAEQPDLPHYLQFEWQAFWKLSTDRPIGFDAGPIPWSAIDRYAIRYGITSIDEFDRFCRLIRIMDAERNEHVRSMQQTKDG